MPSQPPFVLTPVMVICWSLGLLVGGIAFLFAMGVCWLLVIGGGSDVADKHGLSAVDASRIGGALIGSYVVASVLYYHVWEDLPLDSLVITALMAALCFYGIGLLEDLRGDLQASLRFALMLFVSSLSLVLCPAFLLAPVGLAWVDGPLTFNAASQFVFTLVCLGFLPNAFNTSDGANGLLSGTAILALLALSSWFESELSYLLLYGALGTALFFIFNVATGRFFLGDGGAYFLGALIGFSIIRVANTNEVSVWCLLSLIFYPVADLLWSMTRRVLSRNSPMAADNLHLHNLIHDVAISESLPPSFKNTATGLGLVLMFSGLPWIVYGIVGSVTNEAWFFLICIQWVTYGTSWISLYLSQMSQERV